MLCFQKSLKGTWIKSSPGGGVACCRKRVHQSWPWVSGNPGSHADGTKYEYCLVSCEPELLLCLGKSNELSCLTFSLSLLSWASTLESLLLQHHSYCLQVVFGLCGSGFWRDSFLTNYYLFLLTTVVLERNEINGDSQNDICKFGIHQIQIGVLLILLLSV